jgi:competence protein ComEC
MKFINFAVVKFSICLVTGILAAYYFPSISVSFLKITIGSLLLLIVLWIIERPKLKPGIFFGMVTYACLFSLGFANYQLRQPHFQTQHFSHFYDVTTSEVLQLKVTEVLKPDRFYHKYFVNLFQLDTVTVNGEILLKVRKDTTTPIFHVDNLLLIRAAINPIDPPLNPYQFDYKKYLHHQGVFHQTTVSETHILAATKGTASLKGISEKIRGHFIQKLAETPIEPQQRAIMQALLLGERKDIDAELYRQYAAAGAIHILAVSGLHVGILFLIFSRLLSPLERLKFGAEIKSVLLVLLLWAFALLAGLSPSVVRAVTMFSFFALAALFDRTTNSINTLFLSFFVLLIFNPNWLFHVGFQLSYMAVFFILWIQPKLYKYYIPKSHLGRLLWGIVTVTAAAQLGIAPLSMYYFHQFPGLFFLSNLVILPLLGLLLAGGLLVLFLAVLGVLPKTLAVVYNWLIWQLNDFVGWVALQEVFLIEGISFSTKYLFVGYLFICMVILWWKKQGSKPFIRVLAIATLWLGVEVWEQKKAAPEQLVLFHRSRFTLMGYQKGRDFTLFQQDSLDHFNEFPIKGFRVGSRVLRYTSEKMPPVFSYKGQKVVVVDSLAVYPSVKTEIVLLSQNPKVHLERLIDSLHPAIIVADGSNYRWYKDRWKATCKKRSVLFYDTRNQGAFRFGEIHR